MTRRATDPATYGGLGVLDASAIERVREEVRPDPRDADELHDALVTAGFLTQEEVATPSRRVGVARGARPERPCHARLRLDMATGDVGGGRAPA